MEHEGDKQVSIFGAQHTAHGRHLKLVKREAPPSTRNHGDVTRDEIEPSELLLVASLLLVAMPGAPSSFLLLGFTKSKQERFSCPKSLGIKVRGFLQGSESYPASTLVA